MSKVAVVVSVRTKPGRRDEFRAAWDSHLRERVERSAAQELYLFCEDLADADGVHLVELYGDPAEMERNAQAPWFREYLAATSGLLLGPPSMIRGRPVWAKGLPA